MAEELMQTPEPQYGPMVDSDQLPPLVMAEGDEDNDTDVDVLGPWVLT